MEKEISIIAAWAKNSRIIGYKKGVPWHLPEDMEQYREITRGGTMIMGRETFFSIPAKFRPLPGRENIVVGTQLQYEDLQEKDSSIIIARTIEEALKRAKTKKIFFNGGERIYEEGLRYATRIYGTIVEYEGPGDRFFPEITIEWHNVNKVTTHDMQISRTGTRFAFAIFEK